MDAGTDPLRLYWWRGKPNFGDAISPLIVAHLSARPVVWAEPEAADLFALGSILRPVARTWRRGGGHRPVVWGSGCLKPVGRRFLAHVDIAALRGPRTAAVLGVDAPALGDPGLLVAAALGEAVARGDRVGLVPHHGQAGDPVWEGLLAARSELTLIDVAGDPAEVVRRIAACRHVISSSLHGLITADAYGIPSTWLDPEGIHAEARFKFLDYAEAVGRDLGEPIRPADIPARLDAMKGATDDAPLPHAAGIRRAALALTASFPATLGAGQTPFEETPC